MHDVPGVGACAASAAPCIGCVDVTPWQPGSSHVLFHVANVSRGVGWQLSHARPRSAWMGPISSVPFGVDGVSVLRAWQSAHVMSEIVMPLETTSCCVKFVVCHVEL